MYATATNMLDFYGDLEMAQLAAPDVPAVDGVLLRLTVTAGDRSAYSAQDQADADAAQAKLNDMITQAGLEIDSYLSPRYTLPLLASLISGSALPRKCADIARYYLMADRATEEVQTRYSSAIKWLRDIATNKASLGAKDTSVASPQGSARLASASGSLYDWDQF